MGTVTVKRLQREFGMPIMAAVALIEEQHRQARSRYRLLGLLAAGVLLVMCATAIFGIHLSHRLDRWLPLAGVLLVGLQLYLIQRAPRMPILAAASAWNAQPVAQNSSP